MRVYGYARVSTQEQKLDRQMDELVKYVDSRFIFSDKFSGKNMDRPEYQLLRKVAQRGDIIYIKSLDRLGRNKQQIKNELEHYKKEGVMVKILDIPTTMMPTQEGQEWIMEMVNNLILEVLSTIADQERMNIRVRQAEGIQSLRDRNGGMAIGRPSVDYPEQWHSVYSQWKDGEMTAVAAMKELNLKKSTFYNLVKKYNKNGPYR